MMKEVPGMPGIYVTEEGEIYSELRGGRYLKQQEDSKGYMRVRVSINRKKQAIKVHRAVAEAFIPNPLKKPQVNHKDGNKHNNRIDNLEWVTNIENARHAIENDLWGNVFAASRKSNESRKRPIIATDTATGESKAFESMREAEGCCGTRHINEVIRGKRSQANGYTFRYA